MYFRIEQQYQNVLTLWHETHINMKSVVSWHYLINEIDKIRASNVASVSTSTHQANLSKNVKCLVVKNSLSLLYNRMESSGANIHSCIPCYICYILTIYGALSKNWGHLEITYST